MSPSPSLPGGALRPDEAAQDYLLTRPGPGIIGYDGMGAIDLKTSEAEVVVLGPMSPIADLEELRPSPTEGPARIVMRRGVREFDLLYNSSLNALIVSQRCYAEIGALIAPSLREATPVQCVFGSRSLPYVFGNLRLYNCWRTCIDWSGSTFKLIDGWTFIEYKNAVDYGGAPVEREPPYEAENVSFRDGDDFMASLMRDVPARWHLPQTLTLKADGVPTMVNLAPNETLVARPLVEALQQMRRPKSKVLGMSFSYPLVPVRFVGA